MNFTTCSVCGFDSSCVHLSDPKRDTSIWPYGTLVIRGYTGDDTNTRLRVVNAFAQMQFENPYANRPSPRTTPFFQEGPFYVMTPAHYDVRSI